MRDGKLRMQDSLTTEEITLVASLLHKLEPGLLPFEIFKEVARLMTTVTVVLIPLLYDQNNELNVVLLRRGSTDRFYSNMYNPPGTIIRANDASITVAFQRLYETELQNPQIKHPPVFVHYVFDQIGRGREVSLIHWVELSEKPSVGDMFRVDSLPQDTIASDVPRITMAVKHFKGIA
jgi:hypothetical protein